MVNRLNDDNLVKIRGGVAQWVAHLIRNVEVVGSSPIKGPRCFLEQETLPLLKTTRNTLNRTGINPCNIPS